MGMSMTNCLAPFSEKKTEKLVKIAQLRIEKQKASDRRSAIALMILFFFRNPLKSFEKKFFPSFFLVKPDEPK